MERTGFICGTRHADGGGGGERWRRRKRRRRRRRRRGAGKQCMRNGGPHGTAECQRPCPHPVTDPSLEEEEEEKGREH
jgi:hypothetical protein